jgi:predicted nucleotidyltransferase
MGTLPPASAEKLEKIRSVLRREMPRLSEEHSVSSLEILGSFVRGEASMDSDLDLLVEFEGVPTLFGFIRLENELADLLGLKVDLVMKSGLKPALGKSILAEALQV